MLDRHEFSPWNFWSEASAEALEAQEHHKSELLASRQNWQLGTESFVSTLANVDCDELSLGKRSYIAAGAYLTGTIRVGRDCSINPYTVVRGTVQLGDAVRMGAHTSLLGFNHTIDDTEIEFFRQPLVSKGITIGNDVWIGSHVVVLDGVSVGNQTVLAAGAVVTKDVPDGAIVGGNPAKFLRWRVETSDAAVRASTSHDRAERVHAFGVLARSQAEQILDRSWDSELGMFIDRPGAVPTVRAQCDAIEVADLLLGGPPRQLPAEAQAKRLLAWQDPLTGNIAPLEADGTQCASRPSDQSEGKIDPDAGYHVLCVGYALALLGEQFAAPLSIVTDSSAAEFTRFLGDLPWADNAWHAGHWTDIYGTAVHWSMQREDVLPDGLREALIGWLVSNADPATGMWGKASAENGLLQIVNGFYRATRGTFAQWGIPLPYPEAVVDTVLRHIREPRLFAPREQNACNVLDVAHPLWLTRGTDYRSAEVAATASLLLDQALDHWANNHGFGFRAPGSDSDQTTPGLQGTEMWLSTIWYLADILGLSGQLGYRPRGVHRPEPAPTRIIR